MIILGFTGTRIGPRPAQSLAMRWFFSRMEIGRFVHGGASGCDTIAHNIVRAFHPDIDIEIHPTDNPGPTVTVPMGRCEIYPALLPLERNKVIVRRIHGLVAVPKYDTEELRSGTWATVRYAHDIGCPVYLIKADGTIVRDHAPL